MRQSFLDYFRNQDHRVVPSSPVIPFDDPTILFANAGMNQFKDVFTGKRVLDYKRATSSQKCMRAGGKHNDLDNVGFTSRHHTFFEMLGNFSFGDYYKEEAIFYAWEWVTRDLGLPKERLYATVYETDDAAFELWGKIAPELKNGRILRFGKKDNFWSMGEVGPCGPCSEIHFDRGEKYGNGSGDIINGETDRFIEIWNLVFMQDDQLPGGKVLPLPKPSVDTGAGLERIAAIIQSAETNYGIDIFKSIIGAISEITHSRYGDNMSSHHVIADHLRALTFCLADGAGISNEGRGYVLRRILRRAARHGRLLGAEEPFIYKLVPVLVNEMGAAYPEIKEKEKHIQNVIRLEEESFGRTLATGLEMIDRIARKVKVEHRTVIDGEEVFRLYDTYGFPYDLTEIIAGEKGLTLDREGFDRAMRRQQVRSKENSDFNVILDSRLQRMIDYIEKGIIQGGKPTEFVRDEMTVHARMILNSGFDELPDFAVILDKTPFYVEAGGQISDIGIISSSDNSWTMKVDQVKTYKDYYIHFGKVIGGDVSSGEFNVFKQDLKVTVDSERRWDIMRNHTATHLMHAALRQVLGDHVKQSGSYVGPDRLRFDFSHHQPMTDDEIARVEEMVNAEILKGKTVATDIMDINDAKKSGAMALFGEKYGDKVRVVSVPGFSKELCGGTHVENISQIGPFFIVLETGIASGVRRIEAITGREAVRYMLANKKFRGDISAIVGRPEAEVLAGIAQLKEDCQVLQKELKRTREAMFTGGSKNVGDETEIGNFTLVTYDFGTTDRDTMGAWIDAQKAMNDTRVAVGMGQVNGKMTFMAAATATMEKKYKFDAGSFTRVLLNRFGGRGGGKTSFAQGTVAEGTLPEEVFQAVRKLFEEKKTK
ncbi:MAG: alanine--tRNA ligase [candidate division Zixibacteria bacterium]|nr:alanine--tRNA ligase [candidate division Zixibacteria bacterium]